MKGALSTCCEIGNVAPIATVRNHKKTEFELLLIQRELSEIEKLFNMLEMHIFAP